MFWQEEMVGVLSVWSGRTRAFTSRDAQFLTAVAGQVRGDEQAPVDAVAQGGETP